MHERWKQPGKINPKLLSCWHAMIQKRCALFLMSFQCRAAGAQYFREKQLTDGITKVAKCQ